MKTSLATLAGVMLLALALSCRAGDSNPASVRGKIEAGARVVDVRTPDEFAAGAYPGAINIPLDQVEKRMADFGDRGRPVIVYCRSGNRSARAKSILEKNGFSDVTNGGGLKDMPSR